MKHFYRACILAVSMMASAFSSAATSNTFSANIAGYSNVPQIYSVADVRMITATPSAFVLQYTDGNSSDPIADANYALLTKLLTSAPALAKFIRIGTSGIYINPDHIITAVCTTGSNWTPPAAAGNYLRITWKPGYLIADDTGCATFYSIKANSN